MRLVEGVLFGKQVEASRGMFMLPLMMAGGFCMAIAVGLQYFLIFRSAAVAATAIGVAAYVLKRGSHELGLLSEELKGLYREVA